MALFDFFRKKNPQTSSQHTHPLTAALKAGGNQAELAFDILQGKLGPLFRDGGPRAVEAFCDFYDIACDVGNSDSAERFTKRFLPLLPLSDRQIAARRCGLDGSAGSAAAQRLKKQNEAVQGIVDVLADSGILSNVLARVEAETQTLLQSGGLAGREKYLEMWERLEKTAADEEMTKFKSKYFPLLPRGDRDILLQAMLPAYRADAAFMRLTSGVDERTVLNIVESHYLGRD
jgi:hypothetical protein